MMYLSLLKGRVMWAALAVVAMGVVLGGVVASDVSVLAQQLCSPRPCNSTPAFPGDLDTSLEVPENTPPGVNIGDPISATDPDENDREYGDTLTYSLEATADTPVARAQAAAFDIDESTGQIITKAVLDREADAGFNYNVRVRVTDSRDGSIAQDVQITVTQVVERPLAPTKPTVVSGRDDDSTDGNESTTELKVVWHPPDNIGRPNITSYKLQYKKSTENEFGTETIVAAAIDQNNVPDEALIHTIKTNEGLNRNTSYQVRVLATNTDGDGPWSLVGTGSTNKEGNLAPESNEDGTEMLEVPENADSGHDVEGPVAARDRDSARLTYSLEGPDADSFDFDTSSGQIRTKRGVTYDHESEPIYYVTVVVTDGAGGSDATPVWVEVDDMSEPADAPARPTVRATDGSSTSLDISWNTPNSTGPRITGYEVRYRTDSENFTSDGVEVTGTTATISGNDNNDDPWLIANTLYEVQVRARDDGEGEGDWSASGTGKTSKANQEPIFDNRPDNSDRLQELIPIPEEFVNENTRAGQLIGTVRADDGDGDGLTYNLKAVEDTETARAAAALFEIDERNGRILTKEPLNTEADCNGTQDVENCTYTVIMEVWDGLDTDRVEEDEGAIMVDDRITIAITVRDELEAPETPTVTVTSPTDNTKLKVNWDDPMNTGPTPITYDVQYKKGSASYSNDNCRDTTAPDNCDVITVTNTLITGLDADTSYSVHVRARNIEGASAWSRAVTVKTNKDSNNAPRFPGLQEIIELDVKEDALAGQVIPITNQTDLQATETQPDSDNVTYSLEGRDASSFGIRSSSSGAQILTKAKLNFEERTSYSVRVKAVDNDGGSDSQDVTINVTNDDEEPPLAPSTPRVTATANSGRSLDVNWTEPRNTGGPAITDYDIQYREAGDDQLEFRDWPHEGTKTSTKITTIGDPAMPLEPRTKYEVRVRAKNGELDDTQNWSSVATATTNPSNSRPEFDNTAGVVVLSVPENTRGTQNVGSPVSASDADSNRLTYSLEGPGADSFTIVSNSGQIRTRSPLDFESRQSYSVTVKVDDNSRRDNSSDAKSVTIMVVNVEELPSKPGAPRVAGIPGSTESVLVTWDEPANTGPAIIDYDVHYGVVGSGGFERWKHFGADRSTVITGLSPGTQYAVQVRATNGEGTSDWSSSGRGAPNPDVDNRRPAFSGGARTFNVVENTGPSTDVGAPVTATDPDGDTLTYNLEGPDEDSFYILPTGSGGQILTNAALNHEEKSSYSVAVRVTDGRGGTDAVNVTIRVTDEGNEAPSAPGGPTVTTDSSTSVEVRWQAPENSGPPITDYDYRYKETSEASWTEVTGTTITGTTVTVSPLTPSTYYDVQVRANNDEGTSDWSISGTGTTDVPGANRAPEFGGTNASRSVDLSAGAGTPIGAPVTATDPDSGDTLTYSLEGTDTASFDINRSTGQLLTLAGASLEEGSYTVTVVATDEGVASARIAVTITVTNIDRPGTVGLSPSSPEVGNTVTATITDPDGGVTGATWQWASSSNGTTGWSNIPNATSATYTVVEANVGNYLRATVNYGDAAGTGKSAEGITAAAVVEDDDGSVTLSPTSPEVGNTVTATLSDPDGAATGVTWVWEISSNGTTGWSAIIGETSRTYRITDANLAGSYLRATASYTDPAGPNKSAQSAASGVIREDDDGVVTLSLSSLEAGDTVTATLSDPDGGVTGVAWQWAFSANGSSNWTIILGATSATYTATEANVGNYLRATATYTDAVGSGEGCGSGDLGCSQRARRWGRDPVDVRAGGLDCDNRHSERSRPPPH